MLQKEEYFNKEKLKETTAGKVDVTQAHENLKHIREQELTWANQRAVQVAKIRAERDRLEKERNGIMSKLQRIQISSESVSPPSNEAGKVRNQTLEPSLKEKLVRD